jgi:hypothetical protein
MYVKEMTSRLIINNHVKYVDPSASLLQPMVPHQDSIVGISSTLHPTHEYKDNINDFLAGPLPPRTTPKSFILPSIILTPEYDLYEGLSKRQTMTLQMDRQQLMNESIDSRLLSEDAINNDPRYTFIMTQVPTRSTSFCRR